MSSIQRFSILPAIKAGFRMFQLLFELRPMIVLRYQLLPLLIAVVSVAWFTVHVVNNDWSNITQMMGMIMIPLGLLYLIASLVFDIAMCQAIHGSLRDGDRPTIASSFAFVKKKWLKLLAFSALSCLIWIAFSGVFTVLSSDVGQNMLIVLWVLFFLFAVIPGMLAEAFGLYALLFDHHSVLESFKQGFSLVFKGNFLRAIGLFMVLGLVSLGLVALAISVNVIDVHAVVTKGDVSQLFSIPILLLGICYVIVLNFVITFAIGSSMHAYSQAAGRLVPARVRSKAV